MIDLTDELPRADWSIGSFSPKQSVTVHWNGGPVPDDVSDLDVIIGDAWYHLSKDWSTAVGVQGGDGIMYHRLYGRDGTVYKTREDDAVLYHCGAAGNTTSFAWQVMIGEGQSPTPAQLASLRRDLIAIGLPRLGHRNWSPTACPGDELFAFVHSSLEEGGELDVDEATLRRIIREETAAAVTKPISDKLNSFAGITLNHKLRRVARFIKFGIARDPGGVGGTDQTGYSDDDQPLA